jgi:hypothetical protein
LAKKTGLFLASRLIFGTSAKKTGLFLAAVHFDVPIHESRHPMDGKRRPKVDLSGGI